MSSYKGSEPYSSKYFSCIQSKKSSKNQNLEYDSFSDDSEQALAKQPNHRANLPDILPELEFGDQAFVLYRIEADEDELEI